MESTHVEENQKNIIQRGKYSFLVRLMINGKTIDETFDTEDEARIFGTNIFTPLRWTSIKAQSLKVVSRNSNPKPIC